MSGLTAEIEFIISLIVFVTGLIGLKIPIIGLGGLMMGLIMIPYIMAADPAIIAFYVMACVVNILFFIVGTIKTKKGG